MSSLLPPLLSLIFALVFRNVILALFIGGMSGYLIKHGFRPIESAVGFFEDGIIHQLKDTSHLQILTIILIIAGFVELLDQSGGAFAFASKMTRFINSKRKAMLATVLAGIGIFFTDSGNSLIIGPLFKPIYRRLEICKEKLAYFLDSTASPVCILIPFISWGLYIMTLIEDGHKSMGIKVSGLEFYFGMYRYQFYPILTLLFAMGIALWGKDFFLMKSFQQNYSKDHEDEHKNLDLSSAKARTIFIPLFFLFIFIVGLFSYFYFKEGRLVGVKMRSSLALSYFLTLIVSSIILKKYKIMGFRESSKVIKTGVQKMLTIVFVLILAWTLGGICSELGTGQTISKMIGTSLSPKLLPVIIFFLGAVTSFCTGSSWGTFAIIMPIAISVGHAQGANLSITCAAVLSGGLFGDHTSPISDTTLLASMASGSEHLDHVKTQLAYAGVVGTLSALCFLAFA